MHTVLLVQYSLLSYRAIDFTEVIRFYNTFLSLLGNRGELCIHRRTKMLMQWFMDINVSAGKCRLRYEIYKRKISQKSIQRHFKLSLKSFAKISHICNSWKINAKLYLKSKMTNHFSNM